jgi:hypothetical protein
LRGASSNDLKALSAKKISAADAKTMTDQAAAVSQSLGCTG